MTDPRFLMMAGLTALAAMTACGTSGAPTGDTLDAIAVDSAADATQDTAGDASGDSVTGDVEMDIGQDTVVPPSCLDSIAGSDAFNILEKYNEGRFVIQLKAEFDGEAIWLAWSAVDPASEMATIRAARMGCDGNFILEPFTVDPDNAGNSYEADIAISGGHVLIAWHQDYQGYWTARSGIPGRVADDVLEPADTAADVDDDAIDVADVTEPADTAADVDDDTVTADTTEPDDVTEPGDTAEPVDTITDIPIYPNDNMRVYYRTFRVDGTPVMAQAERWLPSTDNTVHLVNNWVPSVAAIPDGRFVITSTWAAPGTNVFQVVAQRFNNDGTRSGDLIYPYPMTDQDEQNSDVAVDSTGAIHMTWGHSINVGGEWVTSVASMTIPADSSIPAENSPVMYPTNGDLPTVAISPTDILFSAYTDLSAPPDVIMVAETAGRLATGTGIIGATGDDRTWFHANPVLASNESGTILLWYRWTTDKTVDPDLHTDLMLKKLAWNGTGDIAGIGSAIEVNAPDASRSHDAQEYYKPAVAYLGSGTYFITWTEPEKIQVGTDGDEPVYEWHYKTFARFLKP